MTKEQILLRIKNIRDAINEIIEDNKDLANTLENCREYYSGRISADTRTVEWLTDIIDKIEAPF